MIELQIVVFIFMALSRFMLRARSPAEPRATA